MPIVVACPQGHRWNGTKQRASRELAEKGSLPNCSACGFPFRLQISHDIPGTKKTNQYEVLAVFSPYSAEKVEAEKWDPYIYELVDTRTNDRLIWTQYWTVNRKGKWAYGQSPPILEPAWINAAKQQFGIL